MLVNIERCIMLALLPMSATTIAKLTHGRYPRATSKFVTEQEDVEVHLHTQGPRNTSLLPQPA